MLDAGLPFVAAGSCMNPERAAASSGGRSVAAAPPTGRAVAGGEPPHNNSVGRPVGAPPRLRREVAGEAAAPSAGRSIAAAPPTGREVAEENLYRPWAATGPRGQGGAQEVTAEAIASPQAGPGAGRCGWRRSQR